MKYETEAYVDEDFGCKMNIITETNLIHAGKINPEFRLHVYD